MIAAGFLASMSATGMVLGTISLYTRASRTRRAMSWAYCAPKSTTRTVSGAAAAEVADDTGCLPAVGRGSRTDSNGVLAGHLPSHHPAPVGHRPCPGHTGLMLMQYA